MNNGTDANPANLEHDKASTPDKFEQTKAEWAESIGMKYDPNGAQASTAEKPDHQLVPMDGSVGCTCGKPLRTFYEAAMHFKEITPDKEEV